MREGKYLAQGADTPPPIRLGVSACLLGQKVRYDGGHKLDRYLTETLGPFVDWVPVCPEAEIGLGIPREPMRLVGPADNPRLITHRTHIDHTAEMLNWAAGHIRELAAADLCGFIFKSRSPSSGMRRVKIYSEDGMPGPVGSGIWARAYMNANPHLPVEDEGRLRDASIRENFIERVFVYQRWRYLLSHRPSMGNLVDFHADHKYLIMAHSPALLRQLGRMVSGAGGGAGGGVWAGYFPVLMQALKLKATIKKNFNVLTHMMGYFKRDLEPDEKQELLDVFEAYHRGLTPLIVPVTLIRHYVRKFDEPYLDRQFYLNPHRAELMLRNHV